jgi:phosphatidylethanolamine-binding protein (PEBP) family uncharacterized protein
MAPSAARRGRSSLAFAAILVVASLLASCGTSGTDLREPPAGVTAPAPTSSSTSTTLSPVFTVFSPAFPMAGEFPAEFTCAGEGISPPIKWVGVPPNTVELALSVTTPGAEGADPTVHWIVAGMPATAVEIAEDAVPLDAIEGPNSDGGFGWFPPCVEGDAIGQVQIQLHAIEEPSSLDPTMTAAEALDHLLSLPGTRTISSGTVTSGVAAPTTGSTATS